MVKPVRLAASMTIGLGLAVFTGAQALSSVSTRTSPEFAVGAFWANGKAHEKLAYNSFSSSVVERTSAASANGPEKTTPGAAPSALSALDNSTLAILAKAQRRHVVAAILREPLSPRAHALAIMAESDLAVRSEWIARASELNRRDIILQGLALERHAARRDYAASIETIDQILRVNPERADFIFPLLTSAMSFDETLPVFERLLVNPVPWRDAFIMHAAQDDRVRGNLAKLRGKIDFSNKDFDRSLIVGLVSQNQFSLAAQLYDSLNPNPQNAGLLQWRDDLPPFDWSFASDAALRAQPGSDPSKVDFSVRPGQGGVLAAKIIETPAAPFSFQIANEITPASQVQDVKLALTCARSPTPFFEQPFTLGNARFVVREVPSDCQYMQIAISARAWSGLPALRGIISRVNLTVLR